MAAYKNLRWKTVTILAVVVLFAAVGVYPILAQRYSLPAPGWLMAKQLKLGLDLKGGVHLVLRVNRDDALRMSTETVGEQLREALTTAGVTVGAINVTVADDLPGRGRAAGQGRRVPPHRGRTDGDQLRPRAPASAAPTTSPCAPTSPAASANRRWCRRTTPSTAG